MSKYLRLGCLLFLLFSVAAKGTEPGDIVVIPIKGEITETQFFFLRRALKDAEQEKAGAVIIDMDTYGGELQAAVDMMNALMQCDIPTYTFVDSKAISAGAMITIATQKIYMSPTAVIGAAAPVSGEGGDLPSTMKDKTVSAMSAIARAASQKNGYNPELAESFINKEKEVKIGDTVINEKGSLLSLSAQEAAKVYNGKPLLAAGVVDSIPELVKREKLKGNLNPPVQQTGFEVLATWITALSPFFLLAGILGIYLEVKFHGTLIPGILGGICFLIFFAGHYVAGLAGWEVFALFFLGMLLLLSELFVHPGTILPGVAGAMLIVASLLWAMVDRYPDQPLVPTSEMLAGPVLTLGGTILAAIVMIFFLGKYLPKTTLFNHLALGRANPQGPSLSAKSVDSPLLVKVGETGVAKSNLRPSGKAEFGTAMFDVVTQGEFVAPYSRVRIVAIEGPRIVVESC
jgi:membrane-bound serine protease (ClpP class)